MTSWSILRFPGNIDFAAENQDAFMKGCWRTGGRGRHARGGAPAWEDRENRCNSLSLGVRIFPIGWEATEGKSSRAGRENCQSKKTRNPQGTRIGPWLFLVMINDLAMSNNLSSIWKFADDTTVSETVPKLVHQCSNTIGMMSFVGLTTKDSNWTHFSARSSEETFEGKVTWTLFLLRLMVMLLKLWRNQLKY